MTKLTRFLLAATLISAATVAAATRTHWGRSVDVALLFALLAALVTAGIFAFRSRRHERHSTAKNLSPSLATLSSAAILAVYAAGYHRTSAVAGGFGEESNRRKPPVVSESATVTAPLSEHPIEPAARGSLVPTIAPQPTKSQQKNRRAKSARAATASDFASSSSDAPPEYAPGASRLSQVPASSSAPGTPAPAAPQIAANAVDPSVQFAAPAAPAPPQPKALYKDGTYYGWGSCRHGDIQSSVTIQDGKIASAAITQCLTRYSCSWIADLPNQVVKRQSPEVDYVSGASQSTDAFYGAVVSALSKARN